MTLFLSGSGLSISCHYHGVSGTSYSISCICTNTPGAGIAMWALIIIACLYKPYLKYILTRETPIGSATTGMRVMGKYVERPKQLCVNAI